MLSVWSCVRSHEGCSDRGLSNPTMAFRIVCQKRLFNSTTLGVCALLLAISHLPVLCLAQTPTNADKKNAAAFLAQGLDLAAGGQLAQAEVVMEKAKALAPKDTEVLTALAKTKARIGEREAATELFREVTVILPASADSHLNLAIALADQADLNGALREVSRAVELTPNRGLAHLNRARILSDLNRRPEAESEFTTACRLSPSNPECFFYWALLERQIGDFPKETSLLRTVVRLQPGNAEAYVLLAKSLNNQSKQAEAIACWRKVLAINPKSQEAVYSLSRALRATDPAQAKILEEQLFSLRQKADTLEQVEALGNQAYVAINNKDWPIAITTLRHAIDLCGDCEVSANLHKDLGLALCESGDLSGGRQELQLALHLNPNDPDILRALSLVSNN